jgi:hypothetical protein
MCESDSRLRGEGHTVQGQTRLGAGEGPLHDSERLRLAERPPHPDPLHSPSQTGVNALMASGAREREAVRP